MEPESTQKHVWMIPFRDDKSLSKAVKELKKWGCSADGRLAEVYISDEGLDKKFAETYVAILCCNDEALLLAQKHDIQLPPNMGKGPFPSTAKIVVKNGKLGPDH